MPHVSRFFGSFRLLSYPELRHTVLHSLLLQCRRASCVCGKGKKAKAPSPIWPSSLSLPSFLPPFAAFANAFRRSSARALSLFDFLSFPDARAHLPSLNWRATRRRRHGQLFRIVIARHGQALFTVGALGARRKSGIHLTILITPLLFDVTQN